MGKKWYQSKAYDLALGRLGFILHLKGPWPLKFKFNVFGVLMIFHVA
jgi:hypothetical protein